MTGHGVPLRSALSNTTFHPNSVAPSDTAERSGRPATGRAAGRVIKSSWRSTSPGRHRPVPARSISLREGEHLLRAGPFPQQHIDSVSAARSLFNSGAVSCRRREVEYRCSGNRRVRARGYPRGASRVSRRRRNELCRTWWAVAIRMAAGRPFDSDRARSRRDMTSARSSARRTASIAS
jgi:hypothetical protein